MHPPMDSIGTSPSLEAKQSRHGKRKEGMTTITFPVSAALKRDIQAIADADERTVAAWLRIQATKLARRSMAARRASKKSA